MSETKTQNALDEARSFVGTGEYGVDKVGRDPVNLPMINHWCQAFGDHNPVYVDDAFARGTRHGGLVAPAGMLQTWTMDSPQKNVVDGPQPEINAKLDEAGFTSVVATNYEHEYLRELRLGERIRQRTTVEDMSDLKRTGLGDGYFVTVRHDYLDDHEELVGIGRMRLLKFRPPDRSGSSDDGDGRAAQPRPRPAINEDNAFFWEGVEHGVLLIQSCSECGRLRHPPAPMCGHCQSVRWDTVTAAGTGTVHSYVVHHHPQLPGIRTPHCVLLVELDEGVRLVSELVPGLSDDVVEVGSRVAVEFTEVEDALTLPVFRPVEDGEEGAR